jgi:hypothetical protein
MREQGSRRQVGESRGIIRHGVEFSWEKEVFGIRTVESLMESLKAKEVGGWSLSGHRPFSLPSERRCVVGTGRNSALPHVEGVGKHIFVHNGCHEFQVTVCDVIRNELCCDVIGQFRAPQNGRRSTLHKRGAVQASAGAAIIAVGIVSLVGVRLGESNSAYAVPSGVGRANKAGHSLGNNFVQTGQPGC